MRRLAEPVAAVFNRLMVCTSLAFRVLAAIGCALILAGHSFAQSGSGSPRVTVAFVGDVMLADTPGKLIAKGKDPLKYVATLLDGSDIRIANLECVIATQGEAEADKPWTFRAHPRVLSVLSRHFDAVGLANNHTGDFGPRAFGQMLNLLDKKDIAYFGGGRNLSHAHKPLILERKGLRIAFLGFNEFFPRSFEADFNKAGIAWSEDEQVVLDIRNARNVHKADLVIPVMHWGWEHEPAASDRQRQLARLMIDAGADAVVGGHPHVTQDVEHYRGKPIVYSLGNFVFDGFDAEANITGWVLKMEMSREGVRAWETFVVKLDKDGSPHPVGARASQCWNRTTLDATSCN